MSDIESKKELNVTFPAEYIPVKSAKYDEDHHQQGKLRGTLSQQYVAIGNPGPLGLCAFALTTFVLSSYNAGITTNFRAPNAAVSGLALYYGGLVQLLAGMWEFKTGNTLGACLFSSYGGFWMSFAALHDKSESFLSSYTSTHQLKQALGVYLWAWSIFSLLMTFATMRTTFALCLLLFLVFVTFLLLSIGEYADDVYCQRAGGIFGYLAALLAWYCALGNLLTKKNFFFTLPLGKLDPFWKKIGWIAEEDLE